MAILLLCEVLECDISNIILQNHAISSALDEYALKTSLGVRNGLLGVENGAADFGGLFFMDSTVELPALPNLESRLTCMRFS